MRLLNQMITNLKARSLVTKVFASASCDANQPLLARDLKKNTDMLSKITADGDMQGEKKEIFFITYHNHITFRFTRSVGIYWCQG